MSAKFFKLPMTTDPTPYIVHFLSKSDDEANERARVLIHEHLFHNSNTGINSGSITDNSKKYETNIKNTTKRLGEVDYTNGRTIKTTTYSAIEITNININDLNKVTNTVKDTRLIATVHFKSLVWKRLSIIAVLKF